MVMLTAMTRYSLYEALAATEIVSLPQIKVRIKTMTEWEKGYLNFFICHRSCTKGNISQVSHHRRLTNRASDNPGPSPTLSFIVQTVQEVLRIASYNH